MNLKKYDFVKIKKSVTLDDIMNIHDKTIRDNTITFLRDEFYTFYKDIEFIVVDVIDDTTIVVKDVARALNDCNYINSDIIDVRIFNKKVC